MFSVALNVTTTKKVVSHFGEEKCTPEKILATRMEKWPRLRLVMGLRTVNPALVLMRTASFPPAGAVSVYALHPHRTSTKIPFRLCLRPSRLEHSSVRLHDITDTSTFRKRLKNVLFDRAYN